MFEHHYIGKILQRLRKFAEDYRPWVSVLVTSLYMKPQKKQKPEWSWDCFMVKDLSFEKNDMEMGKSM